MMVHSLMMNTQLKRQQQQRRRSKCGTKTNTARVLKTARAAATAAVIDNSVGVGGAQGGAQKQQQQQQQRHCKAATCGGGGGGGVVADNSSNSNSSRSGNGVGGICLWLLLLVFMLTLCGNTAVSQQQQTQQRHINQSLNHNNNGNQNNSSNGSNNNNLNNRSGNILLQISTPTNNNGAVGAAANGGGGGGSGSNSAKVGTSSSNEEVPADAVEQQRQTSLAATAKSSSSSATNGNSGKTSASLIKDGESGNNSTTKAIINDAAPLGDAANKKNNNNDDDNDDDDDVSAEDDLDNSSELLNDSEDGYEHSSISPTTYRPTRSTISPQLTSAQERERRLMNVLAARRSALHRPGFRNRIGTTGRTATAVETTSKSPTDPRSICIRNCTKNFTRRTTASCMRQCANFSRAANQSNAAIPGSTSGNIVMVKNSSKTGTGTAQAGEKDTNEILFTDESSHGLLVIAKEQNDTVNHITDENKGNAIANKLRGRRKPGTATVTVATTSIEDDEIQPYLYFGQKLPPLKPNALTITAVSDDHPKLLEVSVADESTTSTTPVSTTASSTLSAVERSRSRFKYNMRGGVSFNRRYTTLHRGTTTPEVPTEVRTTTLRIVTDKPKLREIKIKVEEMPEIAVRKLEIPLESLPKEELREEPILTATPLIITVLSDEEIMSQGGNTPRIDPVDVATTSTSTTTTTTSTTTERMTTSTTSSTTTTTTTTPATTTTTARAITTTMQTPITTTSTTSTTTPATTPTTTTTTTVSPTTTTTTSTSTSATTTTTRKSNITEEDKELLRALGPSLTEHINTDDGSNLIIFVNHTSYTHREPSTTTLNPPQQLPPQDLTNNAGSILSSTVLTPIQSHANPKTKDSYSTTIQPPYKDTTQRSTVSNATPLISTTSQPQVTGEISSTVVTDDQEISLEMQRMNIVTMVLAGIGIIPLLAIILYLLRNYLLKRPTKDDEDFDVCITDQQPISPVKKLEGKYKEEEEDEVDHHKKPPQRQHSLHNKLVAPPLARDNNHNHQVNQKRYDDKSSITSDQEFERSNIRLKSLLGEGNFGQVWKAEADDLSGHFGATRIVAVKTIKACSTQLSLKDEGNIMRKLGSHQNVVTLLGACVETEPHMLIMEYAMRGRLLSLLRAARNATNILPASVPGGRSLTPLSPRTLAGFCLDIARGMEYISEKRIVHRDLAARNVLLDHNGVCKICDFGMSIDLDAERKRKEQEKNCANEIMRSNFNKFKFDFGGKFIMNHWSTGSPQKDGCSEKKSHGQDTIGKRPALPIRWMAPESLQYNIFSTETDIWAFGIVLWEIATLGSTPYSQLTGREVIRRVPQGLRPDLPKEGRHEFYNLMSRCWHKDPNMRPIFNQCRLEISRSLHKWVDDDSAASDYMDVSGFSEDLEQGMVYFNHRISEFECEI